MTQPLLSVVIVTDELPTIAKTIRHLSAQTIAERIELVIGAPAELEVPADGFSALHSSRIVPIGDLRSLSWARAPGIRAAAAPIVALAESHCYPEPDWAERLVAAHEGEWAAVGPAIVNVNPRSAVSWVNLLLDYGPWLAPTSGGELPDLPGHNSS